MPGRAGLAHCAFCLLGAIFAPSYVPSCAKRSGGVRGWFGVNRAFVNVGAAMWLLLLAG